MAEVEEGLELLNQDSSQPGDRYVHLISILVRINWVKKSSYKRELDDSRLPYYRKLTLVLIKVLEINAT